MSGGRHLWRRAGAGVLVLAAVGLAFVAGRWTFVPPAAGPQTSQPATYTVVEQSLQRRLAVTATAAWQVSATVPVGAQGTVTAVATGNDTVAPGARLFDVDLQPVVALPGAVPMFRTLERGVEGADVTQLQRFLASGGLLGFEPDGTFGAGTEHAVQRWQDDVGWDDTGRVEPGQVVFLPDLPRRVIPSSDIEVGARLDGATATLQLLQPRPTTQLVLSETQAGLVSEGMTVEVDGPDGTWRMRAGTARAGEGNSVVVGLQPSNDTTICTGGCATIGIGETGTQLPAQAVLVPEVTGPVVPVAALQLAPDGTTSVVRADGTPTPVEVRARANGLAVVDGVQAGLRVRLGDGGG